MVNVEIVYSPADKSVVQVHCALPVGAVVADALAASGLLMRFPEISECALGIFSKRVTLATLLHQGDRVEIYRPLVICPKEKRRQRAKLGRRAK